MIEIQALLEIFVIQMTEIRQELKLTNIMKTTDSHTNQLVGTCPKNESKLNPI
jgi:hypothetical protein